jgi:hydrogenase-4 membrane subunit HyfE
MTRPAFRLVRDLWHTDKPLTGVGLLMLAALAASVIGLWLDPRTIGSAPAWLKPAKFAASTAIYSLTLAWLFRHLGPWRTTRRVVGWTTAAVFVLEVAIIALQAWRGTASHFNVATPLDATLFSIMGAAIFLQTAISIAIAVALWRQRFEDAAVGWALRLGMTLTIAGAFTGGFMTQPTAAQLADARAGHGMTAAGAHTVGGPDGGAGLPGTGWSVEHGDLRVPHFVGLHAVQALGLFALFAGSRWSAARRVRVILAAASSYGALFAILLVQALRGQSIVQPDVTTLVTLAVWAIATAAVVYSAARSESLPRAALAY